MSSTYIPVTRQRNLIGCMIRPGTKPGGFTHEFGACRKSHGITRRKQSPYKDSREIREAANRVLESRGLLNQPNFQDSTQQGGFSRR